MELFSRAVCPSAHRLGDESLALLGQRLLQMLPGNKTGHCPETHNCRAARPKGKIKWQATPIHGFLQICRVPKPGHGSGVALFAHSWRIMAVRLILNAPKSSIFP